MYKHRYVKVREIDPGSRDFTRNLLCKCMCWENGMKYDDIAGFTSRKCICNIL